MTTEKALKKTITRTFMIGFLAGRGDKVEEEELLKAYREHGPALDRIRLYTMTQISQHPRDN